MKIPLNDHDALQGKRAEQLARGMLAVYRETGPGDRWRDIALAALRHAANGEIATARGCVTHLAAEIRVFIHVLLDPFVKIERGMA